MLALHGLTCVERSSTSHLQPFLAHRLVGGKVRGRPLEHDRAVAHDVDAVRDVHGHRELLLDEENRDVALADALEQLADALDQFGLESPFAGSGVFPGDCRCGRPRVLWAEQLWNFPSFGLLHRPKSSRVRSLPSSRSNSPPNSNSL